MERLLRRRVPLRSCTFSVELVVGRQQTPLPAIESREFSSMIDRCSFVSVGSYQPIPRLPGARALLQRLSQATTTDAAPSPTPASVPVVLNVGCRGTDAKTLSEVLDMVREFNIAGLCVLRGVSQPSPSGDVFAFPTEMLSHLKPLCDAERVVLMAGATAKATTEEANEDWRYAEEKVRRGASALLCTPNFSTSALARWVERGEQRRDALAVAHLIPSCIAPVPPALFAKMCAARGWTIPCELQDLHDASVRQRRSNTGGSPGRRDGDDGGELWSSAFSQMVASQMGQLVRGFPATISHVHVVSYTGNVRHILDIIDAIQSLIDDGANKP